jgi:hypothetical protein
MAPAADGTVTTVDMPAKRGSPSKCTGTSSGVASAARGVHAHRRTARAKSTVLITRA